MKKYKVRVSQLAIFDVTLNAESEKIAREKAADIIGGLENEFSEFENLEAEGGISKNLDDPIAEKCWDL